MAFVGRSRSGFRVVACVFSLAILSHRLAFVAHHPARVSTRRAPKITRLQQASETTNAVDGLEKMVKQVQAIIKDAETHVPDKQGVLESVSGDLYKKLRVMFIGEFSAGKSTLINALTGNKSCETGFDPTTMCVSEVAGPNGILYIDSMGTNAPDYSEHENQTIEEMREADVVFLVLRANQLFTKDEVKLCRVLCDNKPRVATIVNYWDIVQEEEDQDACRKRVASRLEEYLPYASGNRIFFVSASAATKQRADYVGREDFEALQAFIQDKLGDRRYQTAQKMVTALSKVVEIVDQRELVLTQQVAAKEVLREESSTNEQRRSEQARRDFDDSMKVAKVQIEACRGSEGDHKSQSRERLEEYATEMSGLSDAIDKEREGDGDAMSGALKGAGLGTFLGPGGAAAGAAFGFFSGLQAGAERKNRLSRLVKQLENVIAARNKYEAERDTQLRGMASKRVQLESDVSSLRKSHAQSEKTCREHFDAEQSTLVKQIAGLKAKVVALSPFKRDLDTLRKDCQRYSDRITE